MNRNNLLKSIKAGLSTIMTDNIKVILFGSRAREDYREDSDWDLLVLIDRPGVVTMEERGKLSFELYSLSYDLDTEINPVIYTREEWEKRSFTPFYKNVEKEGIAIWG